MRSINATTTTKNTPDVLTQRHIACKWLFSAMRPNLRDRACGIRTNKNIKIQCYAAARVTHLFAPTSESERQAKSPNG